MKSFYLAAKNVLPLLTMGVLAACSTDSILDSAEPLPDNSENEVFATAVRSSSVSTRTAYEDFFGKREDMGVTWSAGDTFTAFGTGTSTPLYTFGIVDPADGVYAKKGTFKLQGDDANKAAFQNLPDGTVLNAIYPAGILTAGTNQKRVIIDMSTQQQKGSTPELLGNYDILVGHAKIDPAADMVEFDFQGHASANAGYVNSIVRFDLDFGADTEVTEVMSLWFSMSEGDNSKINTRAVLNIDGKSTFIYDTPGEIHVVVTDGVVANGKFPVWMAVPPSDYAGRYTIKAMTDKGLYTFTKDVAATSGRVLERGNRNWITADMSGLTPAPISAIQYVTADSPERAKALTLAAVYKALGAGFYYDDGSTTDEYQQTYYNKGQLRHDGLWLMKQAYIPVDVEVSVCVSPSDTEWHNGRPSAEEIDKYYFVPSNGKTEMDESIVLLQDNDANGTPIALSFQNGSKVWALIFPTDSAPLLVDPTIRATSGIDGQDIDGQDNTIDGLDITNDEKWDYPKASSGIESMEYNNNRWK